MGVLGTWRTSGVAKGVKYLRNVWSPMAWACMSQSMQHQISLGHGWRVLSAMALNQSSVLKWHARAIQSGQKSDIIYKYWLLENYTII